LDVYLHIDGVTPTQGSVCDSQFMDGNGVVWKLSDNRQNLVSGSLLFVKELFDGQYAKTTVS
jgi:hypothetical protein